MPSNLTKTPSDLARLPDRQWFEGRFRALGKTPDEIAMLINNQLKLSRMSPAKMQKFLRGTYYNLNPEMVRAFAVALRTSEDSIRAHLGALPPGEAPAQDRKAPDREWFKRAYTALGWSQNEFAANVKAYCLVSSMDNGAMSRILSGETRKVEPEVVSAIATVLKVSEAEVNKRLGAPRPPAHTQAIKVVGVVDDTGIVERKRSGLAPAPIGESRDVVAIKNTDSNSMYFEAIFYFREAKKTSRLTLGKLCVAETTGGTEHLCAAYETEDVYTFELRTITGKFIKRAKLVSAVPIISARML